jgi:hypothetical protein
LLNCHQTMQSTDIEQQLTDSPLNILNAIILCLIFKTVHLI